MPKRTTRLEIDAPAAEVFDLIHDYDLRLGWDSMLSGAEILGDAEEAAVGVRTLCTGTWRTFRMPMETEYVQFVPGEVAAVRLTNQPPLFEHFAATIRHVDLEAGRSRVTYIYSFRAQPRVLAWLLEPIIDRWLAWETRRRLAALRDWIAKEPGVVTLTRARAAAERCRGILRTPSHRRSVMDELIAERREAAKNE